MLKTTGVDVTAATAAAADDDDDDDDILSREARRRLLELPGEFQLFHLLVL